MKKEPFSLAWDRLRTWGKGEKNRLGRKYKSVSEASREVVLGRERVAPAFSPSPGHPSARFARRYFSYFIPFFPFSHHCGACSQATYARASKQRSRILWFSHLDGVLTRLDNASQGVCIEKRWLSWLGDPTITLAWSPFKEELEHWNDKVQ